MWQPPAGIARLPPVAPAAGVYLPAGCDLQQSGSLLICNPDNVKVDVAQISPRATFLQPPRAAVNRDFAQTPCFKTRRSLGVCLIAPYCSSGESESRGDERITGPKVT